MLILDQSASGLSSFFSTMYPVIGAPPSLAGGVHVRVQPSAWMWETSIGPGFPGTSKVKKL